MQQPPYQPPWPSGPGNAPPPYQRPQGQSPHTQYPRQPGPYGPPPPSSPYPPSGWQPPPYRQPYYPPPYQQQYFQQPPPMMRPPQPPKKQMPAILVTLLIFGALLLACGGIGVITQTVDTTNSSANTTSDVQPTDTPVTLTDPGDIKTELQSDANSALTGDNILADYGVQLSKAVIVETTAIQEPLSSIQNECFDVQKTVWQDQQLNIQIVDFAVATINGQLPNVYGECVLDASGAAKIDWNTTDAVTAWNNKVYQDMTPSN